MDMHLVVVRPFAGFVRGDIIADPARVSEILRSEHVFSTVRVMAAPVREG